jgi:hypothetical protein
MPRMLNSPLGYPEALAELWMGDQRGGLDELRDYYLQTGPASRHSRTGRGVWFTDKMPLNETHLGLIALMFPRAPLIHVLRHPLDIVLSVFSNHLTHGLLLRLCAGNRRPALRAGDGIGRALPRRNGLALSADPLRGHHRYARSAVCGGCSISSAPRSIQPACNSTRIAATRAPPAMLRSPNRSMTALAGSLPPLPQ